MDLPPRAARLLFLGHCGVHPEFFSLLTLLRGGRGQDTVARLHLLGVSRQCPLSMYIYIKFMGAVLSGGLVAAPKVLLLDLGVSQITQITNLSLSLSLFLSLL